MKFRTKGCKGSLSTRAFAKIIETLTDYLETAFDFRITYPWQKKIRNEFINNLRYFLPLTAIGFGLIAIIGTGGNGGGRGCFIDTLRY